MTQPSARSPFGALEVLQLLAQAQPPGRFQELLREARQTGLTGAELGALEHAVQLASQVQHTLSQAQQREAGLAALAEMSQDLSLVQSPERLLQETVRWAKRLIHLDMAYVGLVDEKGATRIRATEGGISPRSIGLRTGKGLGMGGLVELSGAPTWTSDYIADTNIPHDPDIDAVVRAEGLHAVVAVPLGYGDTVLGTLYGADRKVRHFTAYEVSLLRSLGKTAAVAMERVRVLEEAKERADGPSEGAVPSPAGAMLFRLVDLALGGAGPEEVVAASARELGATVVLYDSDARVLSTSGRRPASAESDAGARHAAEAHAEGRAVRAGEDWIVPLAAGPQDLGFLRVSPAADWSPEHGSGLLGVAGRAVAVARLLSRRAEPGDELCGSDLLEQLLGAAPATVSAPARLPAQARRPAGAGDGPLVVVVARPEGGSLERSAAWGTAYATRSSGLAKTDDGQVILLLPGDDPLSAANTVGRELGALTGCPVTVGAAGPAAEAGDVARVHREATDCLRALIDLGKVGSVATPRQMGFLGVLLSETHGVDAYVDSVIGPLLDYDQRRFTELVRTLDAYFASAGSPSRAALDLHVHPNTVSRRLERITDLLGEDWLGAERSLDVRLALRLHRIRRTLRGEREQAGSPGGRSRDG